MKGRTMDAIVEVIERDEAPVRKGDVFCSPWCGRGCKHAAYERARKDGLVLARRMGEGWSATVWENLGWFYLVQKGVAEIYPNSHGGIVNSYTCFIQTKPQFLALAGRPEDALAEALDAANAAWRAIRREVSTI